ncbi:CHAD domain-containing protein [Nocardioides sp. CER19]|uniref:CHAD domain-containing protein n=1 Tax=Nocardioides sp. CER19 TaxID=3038538 RepID=UPI00244C4F97|nr:CHAD domain-containing protein [Nocardioides sp. CER19]MDH2416900.1 CHAD domain-containing protein [Nocardioides sp. CER19]
MTTDQSDDPLTAYLRDQADAVLTGAARLPDAEAIHATRVAARRLRSTVRVFAPLLRLAPADVAEADEELRWYAGRLGEVRDRQVQRSRFSAALADLPADQVLGPVTSRIDGTLLAEQVHAEEELAKAMTSERYQAVQDLLQTWRREPPVDEADARRLRKRARKAARKAERRLEEACASRADDDLHRARKAAKRARYAGELLRPLGHGKKQRKRFKGIQRILGDLQDAVVAEATLRRLVSGVPAGVSGFTFGLLHAHERADAERLRELVCSTYAAGES